MQGKLLKLSRAQSSTKISFDDTMEVAGGGGGAGEPDSSEEDSPADRYRVEILPAVQCQVAVRNKNFQKFNIKIVHVCRARKARKGKCSPPANLSKRLSPCRHRWVDSKNNIIL